MSRLLLILSAWLLIGSGSASAEGTAAAARPNAEAAPLVEAEAPSVGAPATRSLRDWYAMGGFLMHPIVACSVLVLAIALERLASLRAARVMPGRLARELREQAEAHDPRAALRLCSGSTTPLAVLARVGIEAWQAGGLRNAEQAVESAAASTVARLSRNLSLLAALANLATLIGLLGTVIGMIEAFQMIAAQGSGDAAVVAGGIFRALVTTAAGLSVGISALALHALFRRRVETWLERIEDGLDEILFAFDEAPKGEPDAELTALEAV